MHTENQDRRAPHVRRVELETRVEICGKEGDLSPFEAESVEVSGRGMQVRTRYLPEVGTPLVLRFDSDGNEVLVEGMVAWRQGDDDGGQFGIKFTALDSKSVTALKALCSATGPAAPNKASRVVAEADDAPELDEREVEQPYLSEKGAPVKLHIQGLGAPMKARVCRGTPRKLQVGSQLEFLKLGRTLELEDVSAGSKRAAHIHSVEVAVEPDSQIPQLVVSLRYEGVEDETPEPTVVDRGRGADDFDDEYDDDFDDEDSEVSEDLFKGKVGTMAANAGQAMKETSAHVARWSSDAIGGLGSLMRTAKKSSKKQKHKTLRRTSRVPQPTAVASSKRRTTRVGHGQKSTTPRGRQPAPEVNSTWKRPKLWLYGGAVALCATGVYAAFGGASEDPRQISEDDLALATEVSELPQAQVSQTVAVMPAPPMTAQPGTSAQLPAAPSAALPSTTPSGFPGRATLNVQDQLRQTENGIVAQVPLFGPKQMATTEPAPLNPAPMAQVDEYSLAKDQAFTDKVVPTSQAEEPSTDKASQSFQVGRMELPIKYRLRLDGPGSALQGSKTPSGFTVLVPGRKVMENGATISQRDDRIVDVRVSNTPAGGKITFRFRKDIPGYKARLKNDFVEFFINSPKKN